MQSAPSGLHGPRTAALARVIGALMVFQAVLASQGPINRLACTTRNPWTWVSYVVFTDAETGAVTQFPLSPNFTPRNLIAMDRYGDVWLDDANSYAVRKFSGTTGQLLATAAVPQRPSYLVTDAQADLLVGSYDTTPGPQASVYLHRFSPSGQLVQSLDVRTLLSPGVFVPLLGQTFSPGILRILVAATGDIWFTVQNGGYEPVIRLSASFVFQASYGLYLPLSMLTDAADGVWVLYAYGSSLPIAPQGWVHLSSGGTVIEFTQDGTAMGMIAPSHGYITADGRQLQYPEPGGTFTPGGVRVHLPGGAPVPWYTQSISLPIAYMAGFHLDGAQRLWALQVSSYGNTNGASTFWHRVPADPNYLSSELMEVRAGYALTTSTYGGFFWTSFWGPASLYEFVSYTDPDGDLDGDGVINRVELLNRTNALLPFSATVQAQASGGLPGTWLRMDYTVPGDAGLPYLAPFGLAVLPTSLGSGITIPFAWPADPLVQASVTPGIPWLSGTYGVLDSQGHAQAGLLIPASSGLSGIQLFGAILTWDPSAATPFRSVSPGFGFTIP